MNIDNLASKRPETECQACGSTRRKDLGEPLLQPYDGTTADGREFAAIVRQRCQCRRCGQTRFDAMYLSKEQFEQASLAEAGQLSG